jgi:hypothetical protein
MAKEMKWGERFDRVREAVAEVTVTGSVRLSVKKGIRQGRRAVCVKVTDVDKAAEVGSRNAYHLFRLSVASTDEERARDLVGAVERAWPAEIVHLLSVGE